MKHLRKFNEEILPIDKDGNPAEVIDKDGNIVDLSSRTSLGGPKMYHFIQKSYNYEYTVLATSKEEALENLKSALREKNVFKYGVDDYDVKRWEDSTIDNLPDDYSIEELKPGEVLVTEVS